MYDSSVPRDSDFDVDKLCRQWCVCVCVPTWLKHSKIYGDRQSPKSKNPSVSVSLSLFFPPFLSFTSLSGSKPGLTYSIPQQTHIHTQRAHSPLRSYKDILLWEWECIFRSFGFPLPTNAIRTEELTTLVSCTRKLFIEGIYSRGFSQPLSHLRRNKT